jgi:hypothetical protein
MIARCLTMQWAFEDGEKRFASSWCLVALIQAEILRFAQDDNTKAWGVRVGTLGAHTSGAEAPFGRRFMSWLKPRPTKLGQHGPQSHTGQHGLTKPYQPTRTYKALPVNADSQSLTSQHGYGN